jgi:hypothetical protein
MRASQGEALKQSPLAPNHGFHNPEGSHESLQVYRFIAKRRKPDDPLDESGFPDNMP